ncbi:unnamed protein product [Calicophoron daubneyi]|uniref:Uncharacterized protein n=1 Tax=Calicophoron daubneyi TaxID=300641 RepID=A0AAV2T425_CALDB
MPEMIFNQENNSNGQTGAAHVRWLDQQQYLIETYRQIRTNLGQLEAEIEAARLRVTDWSRLRRDPSRSRSLSHASLSTNASSIFSCSTYESSCTDTSCLNIMTDGTTTGSSCQSSCSSTCGARLPAAVAASLNAATLISAFLTVSTSPAVVQQQQQQQQQQNTDTEQNVTNPQSERPKTDQASESQPFASSSQ